MRSSRMYEFLKKCAEDRISIKEGCRRYRVNPGSVRAFFARAKKNRFLRHRLIKHGRNIGFRYDGVIVFWDRVERGRGKESGGYPP